MYIIAFAVKKGVVSSLSKADELLFVDLDSGERSVTRNPYRAGAQALASLIEDRDVVVLVVSEASEEELAFLYVEGVKPYIVGDMHAEDALREITG